MRRDVAGTDLGTTNSAIALLRGGVIQVIRNNDNEECTPSAVYESEVDGRSVTYVGLAAREQLQYDPANVAQEFKLKMGMKGWHHEFPGTGRKASAVELSAEVLSHLVNSVKQRLGEDMSCMVITVPAQFHTPMYEATKQAGELAGMGQVEVVEEPVAAAWAYLREAEDVPDSGNWLVYDLGGGTFDVALVKRESGVFTVMDHDGDQRLGGQDVDAAIIERYFLPKLPDGLRKKVKPRESTAWWKLKRAAEDAKIRLSGLPRNQPALAHTDFPEEDGYEFRCSLSHEQLEAAMEPVITKSIAICKRFVAKLGLQPAAVHRVILVGGPTLSPYVRERVGRELGIPVDFRVDPLTAVAKGAAIYATTVPWEESDTAKAEAEVRANLDYPRQTQDSAPTVAGGLKDAAGTKVWTGWHVEVTHLDAGGTADWTSGKVAVNDAGAFVLKVRCDEPDREANEQERENRFRLAVTDPTGREVRTEYVGGFTIKVGMEVGSIRLPHGIGVVEADGSVCWYFDAGRPLPCERTIPTKTTRALKRGVSGAEAVRIPVVEEGVDRSKGKYNWPIGTLEVVAEKVFADIPVRSAVEVTIAVSKERRITVTAFFPTYQVETQTTFTGDIIPPTRETLAKDLEIVRKAIGAMEPLVGDSEDIRRVLAEVREGGILDEVAKLVAESSTANPDAAMKAKELLMRIEKLLDPVVPVINRLTAWRAAWHEFQENVAKCTRALKARGRNVSPAQRMEFNDLVKQFEDACDRRDLQEATGLAMRAIPSLVTAITGLEAKPVDGLTKVDEIETRKGDDGDTQSGP